MPILIYDVPHNTQRYDTCGDWIWDALNNLTISISNTGDWRYNFLVAFHEQIEATLCRLHNISEPDIVEFDRKFEVERTLGKHSLTAEPGDDPRAPYHKEHIFATHIEKQTADAMGVDWADYEEHIYNLDYPVTV